MMCSSPFCADPVGLSTTDDVAHKVLGAGPREVAASLQDASQRFDAKLWTVGDTQNHDTQQIVPRFVGHGAIKHTRALSEMHDFGDVVQPAAAYLGVQ
eukprot:4589681-Pyramimonas_sp.AAC.1